MLLLHGIHKLFNGIDFISTKLVEHGLPEVLAYGAFIGEVVAPFLVVIGYKTRIAASLIVVNMCMAIYLVYPDAILQTNDKGAWAVELPALFLFGALSLVFTGGGKYSISRDKWGD